MMRAAGGWPRGCWLPPGGLSSGDAPPISLLPCQKRNGLCTVQREKRLTRSGAFAPLRCTGVGGSVQAPILPGLRARWTLLRFLCLPSRGGWCRPRRDARTHLSCFSFRAFRFATRCPGDRGGLYRRADEGIRPYGRTMAFGIPVGADALIGPLQKPHQPPGQRQRKETQDVSLYFPGPKDSPRAARFRP